MLSSSSWSTPVTHSRCFLVQSRWTWPKFVHPSLWTQSPLQRFQLDLALQQNWETFLEHLVLLLLLCLLFQTFIFGS